MTQELSKNLIFEPEHLTKETIKKYLCPNASDQELMMGLQIAKTFNLNPLKREVYFVKYKEDQPMQVLTGYEVYLKRAERSGRYNGLEISSEGKVSDGTLKAKVKVFRKDWEHPLVHEVYYSEYVQVKKDFKTGVETPNKFWASKPVTMTKKVCVSQAFRMAFPDEFDGMPYTSDEVVDQERIIDVQTASTMPEKALSKQQSEAIDHDLGLVDDKITSEQGSALLLMIIKNGYTKEDLKQYVGDTWALALSDLRNSHLLDIKKHFATNKQLSMETK